MTEISCPSCGSDRILGQQLASGNIRIVCENCEHVWERVPRTPCPRCGSIDVVMSVYEGWVSDDPEEARVDPMASWEYIERHVYRCRKCHNEWMKSGERRKPPSKKRPEVKPAAISIDELWNRLRHHEGETFHQIRGGEFTYGLSNSALFPDRTEWQIPRSHWSQALELVPLENTVPVQHLFGPSYIYAILMDRRIRQGNW